MFALSSFKYRTLLPSHIIASFSLCGCCNICGFHSMKTAIHFALLFYCKTRFIFPALFRQRIHDLNFLCTNWQLEIVSVHPEHMSLHPSCAFDTQWTWPPRWRREDQPLLHQSRLQHFIWEYKKPLSSCDMQQVLHNKRFSALNSPTQKFMHAQTGGWADGQTDRHLQDNKHEDKHFYFLSTQEKQYFSTNTGCNKLVTVGQHDIMTYDKLTKHVYDKKMNHKGHSSLFSHWTSFL